MKLIMQHSFFEIYSEIKDPPKPQPTLIIARANSTSNLFSFLTILIGVSIHISSIFSILKRLLLNKTMQVGSNSVLQAKLSIGVKLIFEIRLDISTVNDKHIPTHSCFLYYSSSKVHQMYVETIAKGKKDQLKIVVKNP